MAGGDCGHTHLMIHSPPVVRPATAPRSSFAAMLTCTGTATAGIPAAVLTGSVPLGSLVGLGTAGCIVTALLMIGSPTRRNQKCYP